MTGTILPPLLRQFRTASALANHHLDGLTDAECLWRPAPHGPHVHRGRAGDWTADWPEREDYALGPPSIAWVTWHIGFWWTMALDHNFGPATLRRQDIRWPGSADDAVRWIRGLEGRWLEAVELLDDAALLSKRSTRWPFNDRPLADLIGWATIEYMKNAAEIGMLRFLFASRDR